MKLDKLRISNFKNLRDFDIDFDENSRSPHTVLVGPNGAGKSNVLEAILSIFSSLTLDAPAPFGYSLQYICDSNHITVEASTVGEFPKFFVNEQSLARSRFMRKSAKGQSPYLPRFVFGYYSGSSDRFQEYFNEHNRIFYRKLKAPNADPNELPFRPLFLAKPSHGQFVLMAFYSHEDSVARSFLEKHFGILDLESVQFVIKRPNWQHGPSHDRFWGATGIPRVFLDNLFRCALAPLRQFRPLEVDFRQRPKTIDCWTLFLDRIAFKQLATGYSRPQDFFKTLESTDISDLLLEVRVKVKIRNIDGSISFRELSEGEQQLLLVIGLLRFTKEDEALFLLDEPDTHLNPAWSVQYLQFIAEIVGGDTSSHILMATHDPLVFAGLTQNEVRIMNWSEERQKIEALMPEDDPRGMGVEAILTSDLYRLRSALDLPTLDDLDRKRKLQAIDNPSPEQEAELVSVSKLLDSLPFTMSIGDPLYPIFVREMMKAQEQEQLLIPVLSPSQRTRCEELAAEIIQRLRSQQYNSLTQAPE